MTNGEKIQNILNVDRDCTEVHGENGTMTFTVTQDFWNAEHKEPTTKNDCAEQNGCITCSLDDDDCCRKLYEESMKKPTTKNDLGVDAVSRQAVLDLIADYDLSMGQVVKGIHALPSVTPQEPRWIPVSERLPNWDTECLVIDGDGECGVGYYREDAHAWDSPNWGWLERKDRVDNKEAFTEPCGIGKVVAWMPLPTEYEGVEK